MTRDAAGAHARAWLLLVGALAFHVVDEALTGFLDFYNPIVVRLRERLGWWPMPEFTFGVWLAGLIALIILLAALTPIIRRGRLPALILSWILGVIMARNGVAHLAGSVYFGQWVPGATSAPFIFAAAVWLLYRATTRGAA